MAKEYFEKLTTLVDALELNTVIDHSVEVKHFFGGAGFFVNRKMCASLSSVGLAFKLPKSEREALLKNGQAVPLRYFAKGNVKKSYALFEQADLSNVQNWKPYFISASTQI
jgi:TfoX/Sxy family transcriptional regulator of competence genes